MSDGALTYYKGAERPDIRLWLKDDDGTLVDFSVGVWTFVWKVGIPGSAAVFTKSTGITGAAGSGVAPTGVPNARLSFTAGELDSVTVGSRYHWQLRATTSSLDRIFAGTITFLDVIT
jgi:hypothetical protein